MNPVPKTPVSMSRRLTLALVLTMTFIIVLVASGFYISTRVELERNFALKVEQTLSYLDGTLSRLLWFFDHETVASLAETAKQDDLVAGLTIRGRKKNTIYSTGRQNSEASLVRARPMYFNDVYMGELELHLSRDHLSDSLTSILFVSLSVWILSIIGISVLTRYFIQKYFNGPLVSFVKLAESYRRNPDSPPATPTPFIEFQPIERVVKKLANEVLLKLREIDEHRKLLEVEVADRTYDLQMAKEAAKLNEQWMQAIYENVEVGVVAHRILPDGSPGPFERVNLPWCEKLGYSLEELGRMSPGDLDDPEVAGQVIPKVMDDLKKQGQSRFESVEVGKDGTRIPVEVYARAVHFRDEPWIVSVIIDISLRKRQEKELKAAKEAAEIANTTKSTFLANMSHELRTPLNAILGFSRMLVSDTATTEGQREKLAVINRSGEHLLSMINDVLDLSKIEAGHVGLKFQKIHLKELFDEIAKMFEIRAADAGLDFQLHADPQLPVWVKTDVKKLRQILINLLDNAVKFTEQGDIRLKAGLMTGEYDRENGDTMVWFEVKDSGIGISKEKQEKVFNPFVQADRIRTGIKGTGLGLAITKSFVEMMGGGIRLSSSPGRGTLFRVELPMTRVKDTGVPKSRQFRPRVVGLAESSTSRRVLIVEDDKENRKLLTDLLKPVGFELRRAENGEQALELFRTFKPHFIWMDMRMPVMDGYEATRRIRRLPGGERVKIAAVTASAFRDQSRDILRAGCNDVVFKPYRDADIFDTMARHLDLQYRFDQGKDSKTENRKTSVRNDLVAESLGQLTVQNRDSIRLAALDCNIEFFKHLPLDIIEPYPDLVQGLKRLAEEFRFDEILMLVDDAGRDEKKGDDHSR